MDLWFVARPARLRGLVSLMTLLVLGSAAVGCWPGPSHQAGAVYFDNRSDRLFAAVLITADGQPTSNWSAVLPDAAGVTFNQYVRGQLIGFFDSSCREVYRATLDPGASTVAIDENGTFELRSGDAETEYAGDLRRPSCLAVFSGIWASSMSSVSRTIRLADRMPPVPQAESYLDFRLPPSAGGWLLAIEQLTSRRVQVLDENCRFLAEVDLPEEVAGVVISAAGGVTVAAGHPDFDYAELQQIYPDNPETCPA